MNQPSTVDLPCPRLCERVVIVTPRYRGGGAERCAKELFDSLPATGMQTRMLVARRSQGDPPGVEAIRLPGERYLRLAESLTGPLDWRYLGSKIRLGRLDRKNVDVIHLHNVHGGWISLDALQRLCARVPSVWTLHDEWAIHCGIPYDLTRDFTPAQLRERFGAQAWGLDPSHPDAQPLRRLIKRLMPKPAAIICPSLYLTEMAHKSPHFAGVPVHHIPYGVTMLDRPESTLPRAAARERLGLAPDARVILLVAANFEAPYKGMWLACEALARMEGHEATVLLLGRSPERLTEGLKLPVRSLGFVSDEAKLATAYRAADLTLIPSVADNLPYVALESMACATPIICFRVGGLAELASNVEPNLGVRTFDVSEMVAQIRRLLTRSEESESMGNAAYQWIRRHCSMKHYVNHTCAIYDDVVYAWSASSIGSNPAAF